MDVLMVMPYRHREALLDGTYTVVGNVLYWQPTGLGLTPVFWNWTRNISELCMYLQNTLKGKSV